MFLEKDFLANIKIEAETIQLSQPRFFVWIGLKTSLVLTFLMNMLFMIHTT